jgi:hypothetical protein
MRDIGELLLDQPDSSVRPRKGAWLQIRRLLSESLAAALETQPFGPPQVALVGGDEALARAVGVDCDVSVTLIESIANLSPDRSNHVAIVQLPRAPAAERTELLRAAHQSIRPAGVLVVLGTVVVAPGENRRLTPSMRQLIEELNEATGLALHVDELRSVRWHGEPFTRGVILSGTSLSVGDQR